MEVHLTPDQQLKLSRMATAQGRGTESLVLEAVDRFVQYDDWFLAEVEKGLLAADHGHFVDHDELRKVIESQYPA